MVHRGGLWKVADMASESVVVVSVYYNVRRSNDSFYKNLQKKAKETDLRCCVRLRLLFVFSFVDNLLFVTRASVFLLYICSHVTSFLQAAPS